MICLTCGAKATVTCSKCHAPACTSHTSSYFDGNNIAITNSARPECDRCRPPKYVRPFTKVRAMERGEIEATK